MCFENEFRPDDGFVQHYKDFGLDEFLFDLTTTNQNHTIFYQLQWATQEYANINGNLVRMIDRDKDCFLGGIIIEVLALDKVIHLLSN